jgi:hypothetical protein
MTEDVRHVYASTISGNIMATNTTNRPAGVPEENEYHSIHWTVIMTYIVAVAALYLLLTGA